MAVLFTYPDLAKANCFLAKENNKIINQEGGCATRQSPCSSFKIALSLMGYDAGILTDETQPEWPFQKGYVDYIEKWKQPHNPELWIKNSCVWYSQVLTQKLGMDKFKDYVTKFDYGNQDVSGDKGKNNGLTNSWLSSSLKISPEEQTIFMQKIINNELPISPKALQMTKSIIFVEDLPNGWKLYGKTGSASIKMGWFVGWVQKDNRNIIFASYIEDNDKKDIYGGARAKELAKEKLLQLIKD